MGLEEETAAVASVPENGEKKVAKTKVGRTLQKALREARESVREARNNVQDYMDDGYVSVSHFVFAQPGIVLQEIKAATRLIVPELADDPAKALAYAKAAGILLGTPANIAMTSCYGCGAPRSAYVLCTCQFRVVSPCMYQRFAMVRATCCECGTDDELFSAHDPDEGVRIAARGEPSNLALIMRNMDGFIRDTDP